MKKALLLATALATVAGSAFAADLPSTKAPMLPPPPPPPLWTGFYVGLNAGYTFSSSTTASVVSTFWGPVGPIGGIRNDGFMGGGQIGYNWQFGPSILVGGEADIQGIAGNSNSVTVLPFPATALSLTSRIDYLGTVRGRVGWLFTPTLLIYGTGGLAYGGVNSALGIAWAGGAFGSSAYSDTNVGWTAGGGVEWMFWPSWSAKVEYLYYDLGSISYVAAVPAVPAVGAAANFFPAFSTETRTRFDGNIVRAGINYHFNWGAAPIVAKY